MSSSQSQAFLGLFMFLSGHQGDLVASSGPPLTQTLPNENLKGLYISGDVLLKSTKQIPWSVPSPFHPSIYSKTSVLHPPNLAADHTCWDPVSWAPSAPFRPGERSADSGWRGFGVQDPLLLCLPFVPKPMTERTIRVFFQPRVDSRGNSNGRVY